MDSGVYSDLIDLFVNMGPGLKELEYGSVLLCWRPSALACYVEGTSSSNFVNVNIVNVVRKGEKQSLNLVHCFVA